MTLSSTLIDIRGGVKTLVALVHFLFSIRDILIKVVGNIGKGPFPSGVVTFPTR